MTVYKVTKVNKVSDKELLQLIKGNKDESLTVRRLAQILGYNSPSTVQERLNRLEKKGLIKRKRVSLIQVVKDIQ